MDDSIVGLRRTAIQNSLAEQRNHAQQLEVDRLRHIEHGIRPKAAVGVVGGVRRCEYHDENIFES